MSNTDSVVFFDGVCNLCDSSVQFILKHDRTGKLRFSSLQSEAARHLLMPHGLEEAYLDSIVFLDGGMIFTESDAVLRIARYLRPPWKYLAWFRFIPKSIRDIAYRFIARNRYSWFGKKDQCMIPDRDVSSLFLDKVSEIN